MLNRNSVFSRIADTFSLAQASDLTSSTSTTTHNVSPAATSSSSSTTEKSSNEELKGKLLSVWNNMRFNMSWNQKLGRSFSKDSAIWILGRCYHQKVTPSPSLDTSLVEVERVRNPIDNKLMSMSLHEEMPTSSESYFNLDTAASPTTESNEIDRAIEPAEEIGTDVAEDYEDGFDGFKKDFISRIWMTYRKDFAVMPSEVKSSSPLSSSAGYTSDCGWGCMIRSGQMMLAQALVTHFLGRGWRYDPDSQIYSTTDDHIHRKIIRWFGDNRSRNSPFSIHKMVELGKKNGKKIGEWYGPGSVAHVLKEAVKLAAKENIDLAQLHVYVAYDCTIYNQDIFDECYSQESHSVPWQNNKSNSTNTSPTKLKKITTWKNLILFIPLRLGHDKLNPIYGDCIKAMLSLEWCIGIIGGRPKHSLYFIGYQEDRLIHLDPHYCQDAVDTNAENFPINSFHCRSARKMKINKMDPSCCIGFYIPSRSEYDRFQKTIHQYLQPVNNFNERQQKSSVVNCMQSNDFDPYSRCNYPMFIFRNGRLADERSKALRMKASSLSTIAKSSSRLDDDEQEDEGDDDGIEDFVII